MNKKIETVKIIRRKELEKMLGMSRSTIYGRMTFNPNRPEEYDPTFPKPINLGTRAVGWIESEVLEWIQSKIDQRDKT